MYTDSGRENTACSTHNGRNNFWVSASVHISASTMVKASVYAQKWLMSEILPLAAVAGTTFIVTRNLSINPDVRLNKDDRVAGVLENYEEGRLYRDHEFRKYLAFQHKTVLPTFNKFFTAALPGNTPVDPMDNQANSHNQPVHPSCPVHPPCPCP